MKLTHMVALLLLIFFTTLVKADEQITKDATVVNADEQLVKDTTEVVTCFYKVLLQKEEPSISQEKDLFDYDHSGIKAAIADKLKIPETEPGILQVFRKNKELFLPAGMKSLKEIIISSPFQFVRNLVEYKEKNNSSYEIIALLPEIGVDVSHIRMIFFSVTGGKINPDTIRVRISGYDGPMTLDLVTEDKLPQK